MAEQSDAEKTEQPTAKRLQQAHDEGQVARTPDLSAAATLVAGSAALAWFGGSHVATGVAAVLQRSYADLAKGPMTAGDATVLVRDVSRSAALGTLPFFAAVLLAALAVNLVQARGVLSLKPIAPDLSRINPLAGMKRIFGVQSVLTLGKSLLKLVVLGFVVYMALHDARQRIESLSGAAPVLVLDTMRSLAVRLVLTAGAGFLAISLLDYGIAVIRHQRKLRMTRTEIVQEFRESEGDPVRKGKRRQMAQALVRRRMLHQVKHADVIIVNPTSIAVAIRYDSAAVAPVVVAMGRRKLAERILVLARQANVPIVRNIPVARALIATARLGQPIPPALYAAVAEVLAFVYRQSGRLPRALADLRAA
ncbi:MAG TPA: EscU/YscU/HrcU family type III secretion system export apparatus switch protein [Gemmatimonadales bacterium]|jgi:flagellar biosynthetic protein FlhB